MLKPPFHGFGVRMCSQPHSRRAQASRKGPRHMHPTHTHMYTPTPLSSSRRRPVVQNIRRPEVRGLFTARKGRRRAEPNKPWVKLSAQISPNPGVGSTLSFGGIWERYLHTRVCTHMRTQHIEQNKICPCDDCSSLTVSRVTHPSPVKSFWQLTLKNNRNYESCIELIRNVNNVKPKTCASCSLTKRGGFNDNHETLLFKTKCFSISTWRTPCWHWNK